VDGADDLAPGGPGGDARVTELPAAVRSIMDRGRFCHLATTTPLGPHVTPAVFAVAGERVWFTTSRRSVKARALKADPRVAGLVRSGRDAVMFAGRARAHDLLDPSSWSGSVLRAPLVSAAAARFTGKNARFFAGYAVDASHVPLAWTPPGRVFVEIDLRRLALLRDGRLAGRWGEWPDGHLPSAERFRAARTGDPPLQALPGDIAAALPGGGPAALAVAGADGPVVVPVRWTVEGGGLYAIGSEAAFALDPASSKTPGAALEIDRPSTWRARHMLGAMVRGAATVHVVTRLATGARSARAVASSAEVEGDDAVVVRVRPERFVWWRGWTSGTVVVVR
jgi:nitroimidazol reductase NimA-like FMN-containing flavoprotein (pyridoxamine 5'-phosphate oxidase superfamily)